MTNNLLLSIDYSTTCTGWAIFDMVTKELIAWGFLKPKVKGITKLIYPKRPLEKIRSLADQLTELIRKYPAIQYIVVEEVNKHKSRISGKTLDGGHFLFLDRLSDEELKKIIYIDSDGEHGWRSRAGLDLRLNSADKRINILRRQHNKHAHEKLPILNKKHLACRYVNKKYGLELDVDQRGPDGDMADAIGLGDYFLNKEV